MSTESVFGGVPDTARRDARTRSHRQLILEQMLSRWAELTEPGARIGVAGDGDSLPLPPRTYTRHVRELERLLKRMRDDRYMPLVRLSNGKKASTRALWWHLNARYLQAHERLQDVPEKLKGKHGKSATILVRRLVVTYDPAVEPLKVAAGLQWLDDHWPSAIGEPFLPVELQVAA